MKFLILGDGPEELAWAHALMGHSEHSLVAACPGFKSLPDLPGGNDLDGALATPGIEAVIVGGWPELRAEGLRRAAAEGFPILCLHPPGPNADPYYQIALSFQETGAIVVPDLPLRLHPGVATLEKALHDGRIGVVRAIRYEMTVSPPDEDLVGQGFPRVVDVVRALIGEVEAITATGSPPGDSPKESLVVHMRGPQGRAGEVRLTTGPHEPSKLIAMGTDGTLTLEHEPGFFGHARLVSRTPRDGEWITELGLWDPKDAILRVLTEAVAGRSRSPDLLDGTRAMELTEAVGRSLRRGRTIDLHYEEMSEVGNFKSVMTSIGCGLIFVILLVVPLTLVGMAFGLTWMRFVAYAIPPRLVIFILFQFLRFAARAPSEGKSKASGSGTD